VSARHSLHCQHLRPTYTFEIKETNTVVPVRSIEIAADKSTLRLAGECLFQSRMILEQPYPASWFGSLDS